MSDQFVDKFVDVLLEAERKNLIGEMQFIHWYDGRIYGFGVNDSVADRLFLVKEVQSDEDRGQ